MIQIEKFADEGAAKVHEFLDHHTSQYSQRLSWFAAAGLALAAMALAGPALATSPKGTLPALLKGMRPMQVRVVRSAEPGCEPDCAEWISADGDIVDSTPALFQRILSSLGDRKLPVFINSGGGSIEAAMSIGRMLRARALDVSVTRTDPASCAPSVKDCAATGGKAKATSPARGLPNSFSAYCASACTLVLAAGTERLASPWSHVGVHSIVVFKTQYKVRRTYRVTTLQRPGGGIVTRRILIREQTLGANTTEVAVNDMTYHPMEAYLHEMGIDDTLVPLMEATPNIDIHWMTKPEQVSTRLVTRQESGDALLKLLDLVPLASADKTQAGADGQHVHAAVPAYYQGRPISLLFEAAYDKSKSLVDLSVSLRQGNEVLRSQGLAATFGLGGDHVFSGTNLDDKVPFGPLTATLPPSAVCSLRQSGALQISLHPIDSQAGQAVPLAETRPVTMTVAFARGFGELLAQACEKVAAAGN